MVRAARPSFRSLPAYRFTPSALMSAAILNPAWSAIHRMNRVVLVMCLSVRFAARSLLSWSAKWASIDRCDSLLIASSVGSITPSRRKATSASCFRTMRSAVALSVVKVHLVDRFPLWSVHDAYQYPFAFFPPRLNIPMIIYPCLSICDPSLFLQVRNNP